MKNIVIEPEVQTFLAKSTNGQVWKLLEKADRTPEETELMIHTAHASCYHWHFVGTALHQARGHWLLSRVYTVVGHTESALYHAKRCFELTQANSELTKDFDWPYACEAMARANALAGITAEASKYKELAFKAGEKIANAEDRKIFDTDFDAEPWFGMV